MSVDYTCESVANPEPAAATSSSMIDNVMQQSCLLQFTQKQSVVVVAARLITTNHCVQANGCRFYGQNFNFIIASFIASIVSIFRLDVCKNIKQICSLISTQTNQLVVSVVA